METLVALLLCLVYGYYGVDALVSLESFFFSSVLYYFHAVAEEHVY